MKKIKYRIRNPQKTKSMRELGPVDISGIQERIVHLDESYWDQENKGKPNNFKEFHSTKHIIFKFVEDLNDCRTVYERPKWDEWKNVIQPVLDQAVAPYKYSKGIFSRVMLAKLNPKSTISIHKDGNPAATFPHKVHIPIETNPDCTFFVNPNTYHFEVGNAYEVNNQAQHFVENGGETRRIHLIFEYFSEEILQEITNDSFS